MVVRLKKKLPQYIYVVLTQIYESDVNRYLT